MSSHRLLPHWPSVLIGLALATFGFADHVARTYELENVKWHVTLHPETATIDGEVTNTIKLLANEDSVAFDCGPLTIASVKLNGQPVNPTWKSNALTVPLNGGKAGAIYNVEIIYSGKPTAGIYFVDAKTAYPGHTPVVYTQGQAEDNRYWLPTYDYPDNKATSQGSITVPREWRALSNGYLAKEERHGAQTTFSWKMDQPQSTYLISLVAGPFDVGHETWHGISVDYWVPKGILAWGKATFAGTTPKLIDLYSKLTGFEYPYVKFTQAAVPDFMFGGMENTTCVTQTLTAVYPPELASLRNSTGLIAHEMAHQWFGDTVTNEDWSFGWLNEGFATFMPPQYTLATQGEEAFQAERSRIFAAKNGPSGGAARLFMLKEKLGDKRFWKGIHDYLETYRYKTVTNAKFFGAMSKSSGEDLTPFMNEWFPQKEDPQISVRRDDHVLIFTQKAPFYAIDPEAWIWSPAGWVKKTLHFTHDVGEVRVDVSPQLLSAPVFIDPEGHWVLNQIDGSEAPLDQRVPIFNSLPTFTKTRFVSSLRGVSPTVLDQLILDPKNKFYRGQLMGVLTKANNPTLEKLTSDSDPKIRLAAVTRLWSANRPNAPDEVLATLQGVAKSDPISVIREEAYIRAFQLTNDPSAVEKAWAMHAPDEHYQADALNWWVIHNKDLARSRALEALDQPLAEPVRIAAINALGKVGDLPGSTAAYDHLTAILNTTAYQERVSAMNALVAYGDPKAASAIEPLTHENMGFIRRAATKALETIKTQPKNAPTTSP